MPIPNPSTPTPPTPMTPAQNALKAVLVTSLFFATFVACTSAFVLKRFAVRVSTDDGEGGSQAGSRSKFAKIFSLISCFGGGVFLATCLLDLLPDAIDSVAEAEEAMGKKFPVPLPELALAAGFLFILILEQMIIYANEKQWWTSSQDGEHLLGHHHRHPGGDVQQQVARPVRIRTRPDDSNEPDVEPLGEDIHFDPESHSTTRAILLVFALSLHAVFEGLSLGLLTDVAALLQVSAALLIHKVVVGFSLGVRLVQSRLRTTSILVCCAIFSGQVLVGGLLGIALMNALNHAGSKSAQPLVTGLLQSIACGTFLYITTFEILPHELNQRANRPAKMLCLLAGFALIALLMSTFPDA